MPTEKHPLDGVFRLGDIREVLAAAVRHVQDEPLARRVVHALLVGVDDLIKARTEAYQARQRVVGYKAQKDIDERGTWRPSETSVAYEVADQTTPDVPWNRGMDW